MATARRLPQHALDGLDAAQVTLCQVESETVYGLSHTNIGSHVHRPAFYRFTVLGGTRGPAS